MASTGPQYRGASRVGLTCLAPALTRTGPEPPAGRPLGLFLTEQGLAHDHYRAGKKGKHRPGHPRPRKEGWTSQRGAASARAAAAPSGYRSDGGGYKSDAERMEEDALSRVGQRRRRRCVRGAGGRPGGSPGSAAREQLVCRARLAVTKPL